MKRLGLFVLGVLLGVSVGKVAAITVNPASNVTADSAATAFTIPYRDSNGDFAVGTLTATSLAPTTVTMSGKLTLFSRTKAQLEALTPVAVGEEYYCSNCSNSVRIVVSTGAGHICDFSASTGGTDWH